MQVAANELALPRRLGERNALSLFLGRPGKRSAPCFSFLFLFLRHSACIRLRSSDGRLHVPVPTISTFLRPSKETKNAKTYCASCVALVHDVAVVHVVSLRTTL